jgi:hypothetical protein
MPPASYTGREPAPYPSPTGTVWSPVVSGCPYPPAVTTTSDPLDGFGGFSDVLDAFFGPDSKPPRPLIEQLRDRAADINKALTVASRRVLLTHRHEIANRYFEALAAEADTLRRIIVRIQALPADGRKRGEAEAALFQEADACVSRANSRIEQETGSRDLSLLARERIDADLRMTPQQFEHRTAQMLMLLEGCTVERWGGGSGDIAADVIVRLPKPDERRVIIQCKHTSDPDTRISSGVVQQVSGVRQVHNADVAFVVTTGDFTAPARDVARKLGVGLVNGIAYFGWTSLGYPLSDFERLFLPAPRLSLPAPR